MCLGRKHPISHRKSEKALGGGSDSGFYNNLLLFELTQKESFFPKVAPPVTHGTLTRLYFLKVPSSKATKHSFALPPEFWINRHVLLCPLSVIKRADKVLSCPEVIDSFRGYWNMCILGSHELCWNCLEVLV